MYIYRERERERGGGGRREDHLEVESVDCKVEVAGLTARVNLGFKVSQTTSEIIRAEMRKYKF